MTPAAVRQVQVAEVAEPEVGEHQALIQVAAYSVNRGETSLLDAPPPGWRPGKDVAGTVLVAAGDGSGPPAGTRVVGHAPHSGWAERVAIPTSSLAEVPDPIALSTAAALPLAGLTALRLLRRAGSLIGRRLLVTGASGGVGHYLVELATAAGAEVTAVSATAARGRRLRELGARTVTDVREADGWFDVTMESTGGEAFVEARRRTRPSGTVLWFGQASREPVTLDFFDWIGGTTGARIEAFAYDVSDTTDATDLATLVRLLAERRLHPEIGELLPWESTPQVIDAIRGRRLRGNAVLELTPRRLRSVVHVVLLTYTAGLDAIDAAVGDHAAWLDRNYADGVFLASGRRVPRTGGVILAADIPLEDLERRLAGDPFARLGLATHTVTTFVPSKAAAGLDALLPLVPRQEPGQSSAG